MARWCAGQGARVRVWDSRENPPQAAALAAEVAGSALFSGELSAGSLDGIARVYKSPGLSPSDARLAPLLQAAKLANVPVRGELDLFSQALAQLKAERGYVPKILAITGTNGKTTTTSLTGQLVERAGRSVAVAGNIGPTMLDTLAAAIAAQAVADVEAAEQAAAQALIDAEEAAAKAAQDAIDQEAARVAAEKQARLDAELAAAAAAKEAEAQAKAQAKADAAAAKAARAEAKAAKAAAKANPDAALEMPVEPEDAIDAELVETDDADELRELSALDGSDVPAQLADDVDERHADEQLADEVAEVQEAARLPDDDAPAIALIPPPPADPVFSHLPQVWVLELSSFQLDEVQDFNPSAATVLNVTQDHLDWHGTMAAYAAAKARIFGTDAMPDTVMVINRDDAAVEAMIPPPVTIKPTRRGERAKLVSRRVVRFGLDAPRAPGDFGLVDEGGMAWLVRAMELDPTIKRKAGDEDDLVIQRLMPADALRIRGRHNASNALASLALASSVGIPLAPMLHGLREYRGEPHRVEPIGMIGAVEFFDDSKGTNVGATVAALNGLGQDRAPSKLVVILGGDGKGQDFAPLAEPLRRHARAAATIGKDAEGLEAVLQAAGVRFERHATLEEATRWAHKQAEGSDAVLLSPACASLDMFRDYKHRADVFVAAVRAIADDAGEVLA
ncbi:UDP-N-acetylmuramoyl-L-alanine--D-glutamate ligase [Comamonadaceae bacterium BS-T2-15]|uniref:UDP-N-acetylmuramoylalanine--D-glutamate ligase n=2 Tax=Scleromatobacter humisilvae TaxID=2897159 RepID=A0A9X1YLZ2_9BURK|nr:UDP-N-acetylmuramoyl-L-alanine--D-glutamate ligase [Scleromatobacter humisilvae]MCK9688212.1 UDP-N-acetylmuramoyl-L-alanine--D-glutamate ligase [Scleromatobacter humisilvae]